MLFGYFFPSEVHISIWKLFGGLDSLMVVEVWCKNVTCTRAVCGARWGDTRVFHSSRFGVEMKTFPVNT